MCKGNLDFPDWSFPLSFPLFFVATGASGRIASHPPGTASRIREGPGSASIARRIAILPASRIGSLANPPVRILPENATGVYGTRYGPGRRAYRIPGIVAQDGAWRAWAFISASPSPSPSGMDAVSVSGMAARHSPFRDSEPRTGSASRPAREPIPGTNEIPESPHGYSGFPTFRSNLRSFLSAKIKPV